MATVLKPQLTINQHNYAKYVNDLSPERHALDAEGSGRDVQTTTMYRILLGQKKKFIVKMGRLSQDMVQQLAADISAPFYQATFADPDTGTAQTKYFFTADVMYGSQRYDRETGKPYYVGMTFDMTER